MDKSSRKKIIFFTSLIFLSIIAGTLIQFRQTQYKGFFEEKISMGQSEPAESSVNEAPPGETRININTDNAAELTSLDGIGEKLAERIIDYRKKNGDFEVIEDIMRVSGIGEKKFESIKDKIYIAE